MSDPAASHPPTDGLDLDALAHLARLRIVDPGLAATTREQIDRLLQHFAILQEVDTDGVEPAAYPITIPHRMRGDDPTRPLAQDTVLANAPAKRGGCFLVPRVVPG
jgi:aspartyl-tRNA(Asn)/glutamyl-tRNA(Gln) amidotransferase subunit C